VTLQERRRPPRRAVAELVGVPPQHSGDQRVDELGRGTLAATTLIVGEAVGDGTFAAPLFEACRPVVTGWRLTPKRAATVSGLCRASSHNSAWARRTALASAKGVSSSCRASRSCEFRVKNAIAKPLKRVTNNED